MSFAKSHPTSADRSCSGITTIATIVIRVVKFDWYSLNVAPILSPKSSGRISNATGPSIEAPRRGTDPLNDQFGAKGFRKQYSQEDIFRGFDPSDIFSGFANGPEFKHNINTVFGGSPGAQSPFDGFFGNRGGGRRVKLRGRDIIDPLLITFEEAALGAEKQFTIQRDGSTESTSVKIPAGISAGKKLRLTGKGQPGINGGKPGDLYFKIQVGKHPDFKRDENDILIDCEISLTDALLGTNVEVKTLTGMKQVKVPPATQSHSKLRLKGLGINPSGKGKKGDQLVRIIVAYPKTLTDEQKDLIKQLQSTGL